MKVACILVTHLRAKVEIRIKSGQAFPLSLVQMAVDHPIGALLLFWAGGAAAVCSPQRR